MAIQINGDGTITGISVGGLPNGIVDTDMLAANAVSAAKLASGAGGKVLQVVQTITTTDLQLLLPHLSLLLILVLLHQQQLTVKFL